MHLNRSSTAVVLATLLGLSVTGVASAADPSSVGTGIYIVAGGPRTSAELGYTDAYAAQKKQQLETWTATVKTSAMVAAVAPSDSLTGFVTYHQKTKYNCLPALAQSFLQWEFGGYVSPSVAAKQGTASQAANTITKGMGTTTYGTDDYTAFAWINGQYSAKGSSWRYVAYQQTDESYFKTTLTNEVYTWNHMLYVRVDLTKTSFPWHQVAPAQHATGGIGYTNSGDNTNIADPWPSTNGGTCVAQPGGAVPPYSATPDKACYWSGWSTHKYFLAKDAPRDGELPIFF